MKKLSLVIVTLVAVSCMMLTSCKKDKLDGTTWKATISQSGLSMDVTLTFDDGEFDMTTAMGSMSQTEHGTYTYSDPKVTLTATVTEAGQTHTETITGTVNGDKMDLTEDGVTLTFTKQK